MFLRLNRAAYSVFLLSALSISAFGCSSAPTEDTSSNGDPLTSDPSAVAAGPTAAQLLAKVTSCNQVSNGKYKSDDETSATIAVCDKNGAVFWKGDMDIDCDGLSTSKCNSSTDPWYQNDTAFHQSNGKPLNAETLPYVVVPSTSSIWNYKNYGVQGGSVVAVIYNNKVLYAVAAIRGPPRSSVSVLRHRQGPGDRSRSGHGRRGLRVTYIVSKTRRCPRSRATTTRRHSVRRWRSKFIDNN